MEKQLADVIRSQIESVWQSLDTREIQAALSAIPGCKGEVLRLRAILKELETKLDSTPEIEIVFLGPSRHGKSTLLNALAQQSLLPTSDTKPCTASVLRLRHAAEWFFTLKFVSKRELLSDRTSAVDEVDDYLERMHTECDEGYIPDDPKYISNTLQRFIQLFRLDPADDPVRLVKKVGEARIPSEVEAKLGRAHKATAPSFEKMKEGLSPYLSTAGVYWTVVESCEISGPFENWHPNLSLVDLPGTNDSNPHRTAITNSLREKAHAVAIVTSDSNIGPDIESWLRNSSVLTDFLEASSNHRQRLFIVRTKLDSFHPEIEDTATEEEESHLRKEGFERYKREQVAAYREMLREIVLPRLRAKGISEADSRKRQELLARVDEIPVHFISAQAYEAFEDRIKVGPNTRRRFKEHFSDDPNATGVPALREFVNRMAAEYLAINYYEDIQTRLEREVGLLAHYFQREESTLQAQVAGAGESLQELVGQVKNEVVPWIGNCIQERTEEFTRQANTGGDGIRHRLDQAWKMSDLRLQDKQDKWELLQWNTLRATGRKLGEHTNARGKHIDVNEDICSVLLGDVILTWTSYRDYLIHNSIDQLTDQFSRELVAKLETVAAQIADPAAKVAINQILTQLDGITLSQRDELLLKIGEKVRKLESIHSPAKIYIRRSMAATFEQIAAEGGTGCQTRMRNLLIAGFRQNIGQIRTHINQLVQGAVDELLESCSSALQEFSANASARICHSLEAVAETSQVANEAILREREDILSHAMESLERNRHRSQADYWAWHDTLYPGGSATSPEWQELSKAVTERDGWKCVRCNNSDGELHSDHIVPLSKGGSNDIANLQALCLNCHEEKTGRPLRSWRTRAETVSGTDS